MVRPATAFGLLLLASTANAEPCSLSCRLTGTPDAVAAKAAHAPARHRGHRHRHHAPKLTGEAPAKDLSLPARPVEALPPRPDPKPPVWEESPAPTVRIISGPLPVKTVTVTNYRRKAARLEAVKPYVEASLTAVSILPFVIYELGMMTALAYVVRELKQYYRRNPEAPSLKSELQTLIERIQDGCNRHWRGFLDRIVRANFIIRKSRFAKMLYLRAQRLDGLDVAVERAQWRDRTGLGSAPRKIQISIRDDSPYGRWAARIRAAAPN